MFHPFFIESVVSKRVWKVISEENQCLIWIISHTPGKCGNKTSIVG